MIAEKMMQRKKWMSRDVKLVTCRREVITSSSPTGLLASQPSSKSKEKVKNIKVLIDKRLAYHIFRCDMIDIGQN